MKYWFIQAAAFSGALCTLLPTSEAQEVVMESPTENTSNSEISELSIFSMEWEAQYFGGRAGCSYGRGSYRWRPAGFGSNINNLLESWVRDLVMKNWEDLAVLVSPGFVTDLRCGEESGQEGLSGWDCLYSPMPHVCVFDSPEEWKDYMSNNAVSTAERYEAQNASTQLHIQRNEVAQTLVDMGMDHLDAIAVLANHLWRNMAPWLREEVNSLKQHDSVANVTASPFLGIHIRRGDKLLAEAKLVPSETYLSKAAKYIRGNLEDTLSVEEIQGIWVASDDATVITEIRQLAPMYFPNVDTGRIVWVSGGMGGGPETKGVQTNTRSQGMAEIVYMFTDYEQLAAADLFVGTYSSNVGRFVHVLREVGKKPRTTSITMDRPRWHPGRSLSGEEVQIRTSS